MANYADIQKMNMVELIELYKIGTDAERAMVSTKVIMDNDKLITHLLKKHFPSYIKCHYDDMCQEARIAIAQHFESFDPEKGKFSTFISLYVLEAFKWYICNLHGISSHYFTQLKRYNQAVAILMAKGNEDITADMIAEEMGVGLDAVLTVSAIKDRMNNVSIEGDEKDKSLSNSMLCSPEEHFEKVEQHQTLYLALRRLSDDERQVVVTSFLSGEGRELPLREVSRRLKMDVSTVRRLKNRALRSLSKDVGLISISGGVRDLEIQNYTDSIVIDFIMSDEKIDENIEIALNLEL